MNDFLLFSGSSNEPLAAEIAQKLGVKLGSVELTRFADSECRVYLKEDVTDKTVFVLQSLSAIADQNLVELCLMGQAAKDLGATKCVAVIPWMGYSKQDKAFRSGEAVSIQLVAKFIQTAGFDEVITVQLHSTNVVPFFQIPVSELSAGELLRTAFFATVKKEGAIVVSPDIGGKDRAQQFATDAGIPIVYLEKRRNLETGDVTVTGISGDVSGKDVILFDDIINTGATAIKTSEYLKSHGAGHVYFLAVHAVLSTSASPLLDESAIDEIMVTDTIQIPGDKKFSKLKVQSVAPLLADAISSRVG